MFHRLARLQPGLAWPRPGVIAVVLLGLMGTACGAVTGIFDEPIPPPCPSVSILANADRITLFRSGPGRDLIDITAEARIDDFIARCLYDVDEETGVGQVTVELSLGMTAARGAANVDGFTEFRYFITLMKLDKTVLTKNTFTIVAPFEGNRFRLSAYDDPVILTIPIKPPQTGQDFLIYVGFQVTPEQLEYNRLTRQPGT